MLLHKGTPAIKFMDQGDIQMAKGNNSGACHGNLHVHFLHFDGTIQSTIK